MIKNELINYFEKSFSYNENNPRGIGIECEIPIITAQGEAVDLSVIQEMFNYLENNGFELERDGFSNLIIAATKKRDNKNYAYNTDTITTDTGYSILEIVLAPQNNLHDIQTRLNELLLILISCFDDHDCKMLGYGIQPCTSPSRKLLMPKERYCFFEKFSTHYIVPKSIGADSDLLNISASNQCHIEIDLKKAIRATNMLNALSGLQIALHANSPIWCGKIDAIGKANRELFWDHCFPDRRNQVGIPPKFNSIENYVAYLLHFKPLLVLREKQFFQILNNNTFEDYLQNSYTSQGKTLCGQTVDIQPETNDISELIPFSWFNARLVPKYGTVESRMCCQQPPGETLTSTALTLGLVENLEEAEYLMNTFQWETWQETRIEAAKYTFDATIDGVGIVSFLSTLLDIAGKGLKKRGLGEEVFLTPLYTRLTQRMSPADTAIAIFEKEGMEAFLDQYAFNKEHFLKPVADLSQAAIL